MDGLASNTLIVAEWTETDALHDRAVASIVGGAIADSMGWITEFMRSSDALQRYTGLAWLDRYVSWPKNTGGRFNTYVDQINAGDYSDDTQLTLCVARSIEPDGRFNASYFAKVELVLWTDYARGAGSTVTAAAKAAARKSATWNNNFFSYGSRQPRLDYQDAGANGAAMRVAPLAIANRDKPEQLVTEGWRNAIITHGHPRAIIGALVFAEALRMVLAREDLNSSRFFPRLTSFVAGIALPPEDTFSVWEARWNQEGRNFQTTLAETKVEAIEAINMAASARDLPIEEVLKRLGCYDSRTRGSGIGTVAAALALFYRFGGDFKKAVEHAVNLIGTDTDTIGAMAGALSGALGGMQALPEQWLTKVQDYNYLNRVGEALYRIATGEAQGWELGPYPNSGTRDDRSGDLQKPERLARGQRVVHPIFGKGWVQAIQTQEIRRRSGGRITLIDVEFDAGQSVRLRSRQGLMYSGAEQIQLLSDRFAPILVNPLAVASPTPPPPPPAAPR